MKKQILGLATLCSLHSGAAAVPVVLASSLTPPYAGGVSSTVGIVAQAFRNTFGPAQFFRSHYPFPTVWEATRWARV